MNVTHEVLMHAVCPFVDGTVFDYYEVRFHVKSEVDVHYLESVVNMFRGERLSQEAIAESIYTMASQSAPMVVEVTGRHSANSSTVVRVGDS